MSIFKQCALVCAILLCASLCACAHTEEPTPAKSSESAVNKSDLISDFIGCWKYDSGDRTWYIEIKDDGTWEQLNSFSESMDEGMYTLSGNTLRVEGEMYSDEYIIQNGKLKNKAGEFLTQAEVPAPDTASAPKGYSSYSGNWYIDDKNVSDIVLILGSDLTWSVRSKTEELAKGKVQKGEGVFELCDNEGNVLADVYAEDDGSLTLNISKSDLNDLPRTAKFKRSAE